MGDLEATCESSGYAESASESSRTRGRSQESRNQAGNMPMTDPIADMLTRVRNGQMARSTSIRAPYSKIKFAVAKILEKEGYVAKVDVAEADNGKFQDIIITLKYDGKTPAIRQIKRISKPGRRVYAKVSELPRVFSDIGIAIVSTPNGLMTNKDARKRKLGGEVICEVF